MSTLANGPIIAYYNGVTFPTEMQSSVTARAILDSSGRTTKMVVNTLNIKATLGQSNQPFTTDFTMEALRQRLLVNGGELHYEGAGYGVLACNTPAVGPTVGSITPARDVIWGPKPKMLKWSPKGQLAADVEWEVEVALEPCDNAAYVGGVMEHSYETTWELDASGYTKRTTKGHYSIPQTKLSVGSTAYSDWADRLRFQFLPSLLAGFRRIPGTYTLSEDKCTQHYTVSDVEEGPSYPPPGIVRVSASHDVSSDMGPGGVGIGGRWIGTLQASYEVARGVSRGLPYTQFWKLVYDRTRGATRARFREVMVDGVLTGGQALIILDFQAKEPEIYGRRCAEFVVRYTFLSALEHLASASGLWASVPNSNWILWAGSMTGNNKPWSPRGTANLKFDGTGDAIVDLCNQTNASASSPGSPGGTPSPGGGPDSSGGDYGSPGGPDISGGDYGPDDPPVKNDMPDADTSWLLYKSTFRIEKSDQTIELKPLPLPQQAPQPAPYTLQGGSTLGPPTPAPTNAQTQTPGGPTLTYGYSLASTSQEESGGTSGPIQGSGPDASSLGIQAPTSGSASIIQTRAAPSYYAYLEGHAVRAGYPIAPPALISVGGCDVVQANRAGREGFSNEIASNWFGLDIYAAKWKIRYLVVGTPTGQIPVMDTPFAGAGQ